MEPLRAEQVDWDSIRSAWVDKVSLLCDEVEGWAKARGWVVQRTPTMLNEENLGHYSIDALMILIGVHHRIYLEPVARNVLGGDGRVDILSYPSMNGMSLISTDEGWELFTESRLKWPESWGQETFCHLIDTLK